MNPVRDDLRSNTKSMKVTPPSSQGFVNQDDESKHQKLQKSEVARQNDDLASVDKTDTAPLHRKEDLSQGDEGVDDPQ